MFVSAAEKSTFSDLLLGLCMVLALAASPSSSASWARLEAFLGCEPELVGSLHSSTDTPGIVISRTPKVFLENRLDFRTLMKPGVDHSAWLADYKESEIRELIVYIYALAKTQDRVGLASELLASLGDSANTEMKSALNFQMNLIMAMKVVTLYGESTGDPALGFRVGLAAISFLRAPGMSEDLTIRFWDAFQVHACVLSSMFVSRDPNAFKSLFETLNAAGTLDWFSMGPGFATALIGGLTLVKLGEFEMPDANLFSKAVHAHLKGGVNVLPTLPATIYGPLTLATMAVEYFEENKLSGSSLEIKHELATINAQIGEEVFQEALALGASVAASIQKEYSRIFRR